jgi:hypothetical protein
MTLSTAVTVRPHVHVQIYVYKGIRNIQADFLFYKKKRGKWCGS